MNNKFRRFQAGDKVICRVDYKRTIPYHFLIFYPNLPVMGQVYVVREVVPQEIEDCPVNLIHLVGIETYKNTANQKMAFSSNEFQLLDDAKNSKSTISGEYDFLQ